MRGIAKSFGAAPALRGADLVIARGEIHALLGENGAGKSTLMHVLFGITVPDAGSVEVEGRSLPPGSPRAAMDAGIGMVHQHFSQVSAMTVADNVWLGRPGFGYDREAARAAVRQVGTTAGLVLDPDAVAGDLPIGLRQRLEIVKALSHGARMLILDEPTAALTPPEVRDLFTALRAMAQSGLAVVLITHKLREVAQVADRVTVLRQGRVVITGSVADFDAPALARAMLGDAPAPDLAAELIPPPAPASPGHRVEPVLTVRGPVSLDVHPHEIVGIAAVEGNGQRELMRAVAGLGGGWAGSVTVRGAVGFVPEDRHHEGLILDFSIAENLALTEAEGFWLKRRYLESRAAVAIDELDIRTSNARAPVRALSGGNQQKVVLARVLGSRPALLVAENPTRGLDIRATADIHAALREAARTRGMGVLFHSTDLDEVLALSDRIGVMSAGRWQWAREEQRNREAIGAMMLGASS